MKTFFETFTNKIFSLEGKVVPVVFAMSLFMTLITISEYPESTSYVWSIFLTFVSLLHFIGLKAEKIIFRLIGSWFSFLVWTWLSFVTLNMFLCFIAFCIGIFNIIVFISLSNRIKFD